MNRKDFLKTVGTAGALSGALTILGNGCPCVVARADEPLPEKGSPARKRVDFSEGWAKRFFDVLDAEVDERTRVRIMEANGRACYLYSIKDRKIGPMPVDALIEAAQKYVGKENAWRDGNTIYFNYVKNPDGLKVADGYCLCPLVESGPPGLSGTFCACSVGYVREMFTLYLGKPVHVELLESLKRGGKRCRFKITLT
jgi:Family of unknown function (DUF6144)